MANDDYFLYLAVSQERNHCGACSLAVGANILGIECDQRDVAFEAGKPWATYRDGLGEDDLRTAAEGLGMRATYLRLAHQRGRRKFLTHLRRHLSRGLPAVLLVNDTDHWVVALKYERGLYTVNDPIADTPFSRWNSETLARNCWCDDGEGYLGYFAILLRRRDGRPPPWTMTEDLLKLSVEGCVDTATNMADDLREMVARAGGGTGTKGTPLSGLIVRRSSDVLDSVVHWPAARSGRTAVRRLLTAYVTVADAARLHFGREMNVTSFVAQMTAVVTSFAWCNEL